MRFHWASRKSRWGKKRQVNHGDRRVMESRGLAKSGKNSDRGMLNASGSGGLKLNLAVIVEGWLRGERKASDMVIRAHKRGRRVTLGHRKT